MAPLFAWGSFKQMFMAPFLLGEALNKCLWLHFLPGKLSLNNNGSTFRWGSHAQTSTTSLFAGEALLKRARLHFLSGELCLNEHASGQAQPFIVYSK